MGLGFNVMLCLPQGEVRKSRETAVEIVVLLQGTTGTVEWVLGGRGPAIDNLPNFSSHLPSVRFFSEAQNSHLSRPPPDLEAAAASATSSTSAPKTNAIPHPSDPTLAPLNAPVMAELKAAPRTTLRIPHVLCGPFPRIVGGSSPCYARAIDPGQRLDLCLSPVETPVQGPSSFGPHRLTSGNMFADLDPSCMRKRTLHLHLPDSLCAMFSAKGGTTFENEHLIIYCVASVNAIGSGSLHA
ncbi:hypothetical protein BJ912DRAFT_1064017 [Pholiota molesta]|nr:hypothetical protein BJ912DRAFT_1064017 [Pholiota molesta]